eukprot:ANDGO_05476.mRNA.1 Ras guanine nucleotide exchange factor F
MPHYPRHLSSSCSSLSVIIILDCSPFNVSSFVLPINYSSCVWTTTTTTTTTNMSTKIFQHYALPLLVVLFTCNMCAAQLTWTLRSPTTATNPSARTGSSIGYLASGRQLVMFGGKDASGAVLQDTWMYYFDTNAWVPITATNTPPARHGAYYGMFKANGATTSRFVIAMGRDASGGQLNDAWVFDASVNAWSQITISGDVPSARIEAAGGFFGETGVLMIANGRSGDDVYSDSYKLDLNTGVWTKLTSNEQNLYNPTKPHPRYQPAGIPVSASKMVVFGGCLGDKGSVAGPCPYNDAWYVDASDKSWKQIAQKSDSSKTPVPRTSQSAFMWPGNKYVLFYGGKIEAEDQITRVDKPGSDEIAVLDGTSLDSTKWKRVKSNNAPSSVLEGSAFLTTADPSTVGVIVFGGKGASGLTSNIYTLTGSVDGAPEITGNNSWFSLLMIHAILMFVGWALFMPIGTILARYLSGSGNRLILISHIVFQTTGLLVGIAAFAVGMTAFKNSRFTNAYEILLLITLILGLLSFVSIGFMPALGTPRRKHWNIIHNGLGYLTMLVAATAISLLLFLIIVPQQVWIAWYVYLGVVLVVFAVLECFHRKRKVVHRDIKV